MAEREGRARCDYCGAAVRSGRACPAHIDLLALDPERQAEGQPLSEGQRGMPRRSTIGRRGKRR